jgi:hypothetical protein
VHELRVGHRVEPGEREPAQARQVLGVDGHRRPPSVARSSVAQLVRLT